MGNPRKTFTILVTIIVAVVGNGSWPVQKSTLQYFQSLNMSGAESDSKKSLFLPIEDCALEESSNPDSPANMYKTGLTNIDFSRNIRVLIFSIDFEDRKASTNSVSVLTSMTSKVSRYFKSISSNKVNFTWTQSLNTSRMEKSLTNYEMEVPTDSLRTVEIIKDAQKLAFEKFVKSEFDYFIAVPPNNIGRTGISRSLSLLSQDNLFINSTILAHDFWTSKEDWTIPAHEIGHAMGLLDLYSTSSAEGVGNNRANFFSQFQFMGPYDLMNWPTGPAPELSAWNRWQLGFLEPHEIRCLSKASTVTTLDALEQPGGGVRALFLKLDRGRMLVIENRQKIGYDKGLPSSAVGVIVYTVDLMKLSGFGPLKLVNSFSNGANLHYEALKRQKSLVFDGIKVECLFLSKSQALVRVSRLSDPRY